MRKITTDAINAFYNNEKFNRDNTSVMVDDVKTSLLLHGNCIAIKNHNGLFITNCGWSSNTTKERLNGLHGVSINQKNYQWFLNGESWDGDLIKVS